MQIERRYQDYGADRGRRAEKPHSLIVAGHVRYPNGKCFVAVEMINCWTNKVEQLVPGHNFLQKLPE
jgi:hypothetical protein